MDGGIIIDSKHHVLAGIDSESANNGRRNRDEDSSVAHWHEVVMAMMGYYRLNQLLVMFNFGQCGS